MRTAVEIKKERKGESETNSLIYLFRQTHTYTHTQTNKQTNKQTNTHTHTHTHTPTNKQTSKLRTVNQLLLESKLGDQRSHGRWPRDCAKHAANQRSLPLYKRDGEQRVAVMHVQLALDDAVQTALNGGQQEVAGESEAWREDGDGDLARFLQHFVDLFGQRVEVVAGYFFDGYCEF